MSCCPDSLEDLEHLFFTCPHVAAFWAAVSLGTPPQGLHELHDAVPLPSEKLCHTASLLLLWVIWNSRNRMVFDGVN